MTGEPSKKQLRQWLNRAQTLHAKAALLMDDINRTTGF